jgi:23S rRNA (cytosine1962-C5)-methyltransferase
LTPRVTLLPRKAQPFYARHPWVYPGAIAEVVGDPADGAEVDLYSSAGHFIARGLFNARSKIRVRLYCWQPGQALDHAFFAAACDRALRLRRDLLRLTGPESACRLIFSEGDGLSGMTVDQYGQWLCVQFTALGLAQRRDLIAQVLAEVVQPRGIYLRTERGIGSLEGLQVRDGLLWGEPPPDDLTIREGPLLFRVNLREGQKTGFYLDQRDNRQLVARLAVGRRVLDAFCYTGGFGLHAAAAGAESVECVDSSAAALELARLNAQLNGLTQRTQLVQADVFDHLDERVRQGRRYGLVVLDPPKFARSRSALPEALRGYRRLLSLALRLVEDDGVVVMCCCTGLVTRAMLEELLAQSAVDQRCWLQLLAATGQAPDHPVASSCPESNYLKCLVSRVSLTETSTRLSE